MITCSTRVITTMSLARIFTRAQMRLTSGSRAQGHQQRIPSLSTMLRKRSETGQQQAGFGGAPFKQQADIKPKWRQQALKSSENGVDTLKHEAHEGTKPEEPVSDGKKILCEFLLQQVAGAETYSRCQQINYVPKHGKYPSIRGFPTQSVISKASCKSQVFSAVAMAVQNSGGNSVLQTVQVMAAHAVILPLIISSGLEISGAHFNPMVTACFVSTGKLSVRLGLAYVAAQLAGGVVGAAAAFSSLPSSMQTLAHAGIQQVPAASTVQQAFMGEIYASFAFIFVLFGTNVDPRGWGKLKPAAIPLIITLLMWLVGPVSSMCINPARAFGPAVVTGFWDHHWIWWSAPFVGGVSAAKIYHSFFLPKSAR